MTNMLNEASKTEKVYFRYKNQISVIHKGWIAMPKFWSKTQLKQRVINVMSEWSWKYSIFSSESVWDDINNR